MSCQNLQVRFKALDKALVLFNLLREIFEQLVLQTILLALVVGFHQLQSGYLHIQIHTLFDTGVSGAQSLDLGKTEGGFIHIIAGAHRRFRSHDLADKFLLVLHRLPEISVKGSFGHIAVHMDKRVLVALALDTALTLGKVSRSFFADSSYMLSFSVLCSCVCSRLISPSVSSWHKQDNTLMHQSPGHIQRRTPYNF